MVDFGSATVEDLPAVQALLTDAGGNDAGSAGDPSQHLSADLPADEHQLLTVGRFGGRVVCCSLLTVLHRTLSLPRRGLIEGVRVHPDVRGRGIENVLVWWTIEQAKSRRCDTVHVLSGRADQEAVDFYERLGFESSYMVMTRLGEKGRE